MCSSDLVSVTDVGFGSTSASNLVVVSDTKLEAVVPSGLSGQTVTVVVTNRWGNQSSQQVQVSIDPSAAP